MQTFTVLMSHVAPEIEWTVRVISALLLLGVLAEIASWIVGPSRGMYVTAQKNLLPAAFAKMNKKWRTGNAGHFTAGDYFYRVDHPHQYRWR